MNKILLVDDSHDLIEFFAQLLTIHHYEVKTAVSKKDMEEVLTYYKPDLVLMDVLLNGNNGKEICKQIKKEHNDIAVILLSASPELLKDYLQYEADDIVEKPFDINIILNSIKKCIEKVMANKKL